MRIKVLDEKSTKPPLNIFTWHIHGSYLYYLSQSKNQFYLPTKNGRPEGYGGRSGDFAWGANVHEIPIEQVQDLDLDCILFQSRKNFLEDQYEILSPRQRDLPKIYLEHDPPRDNPTDTKHIVDDPDMLLVHVTHFNRLMWDSNRTSTRVIDHGVVLSGGVNYTGELPRGLVVVNNLSKRGRRLGQDIFDYVRKSIPLDLIGINSQEAGGLGPIPLNQVAEFASHYRFFFNPIRYTSLGLAVCEAMMLGMPIIGLATTEMATVVKNGVSGYVDTDVDCLIQRMKNLLDDYPLAQRLSAGAQKYARQRFGIERFAADWDDAFRSVSRREVKVPISLEDAFGDRL